eukprot:405800-Pelagomonas_calceolata.AAC.1
MHGLHHAHSFQQKIRSADPVDFSQLVVDLRSRHLTYWAVFFLPSSRPQQQKIQPSSLCALPTKYAHITYPPYSLPKYFFLDVPKHVVRSMARFRLRVHTLKVEQASWDDTIHHVHSFHMFSFINQNNNKLSKLSFKEKKKLHRQRKVSLH